MTTVDLLGRSAELATARRLIGEASAEHRTILIEGEPGIGKTRVWLAAIDDAAAQGTLILSCRCAEAELALPFTALADLMAGVPKELRESLPPPQRRALEVALLQADPVSDLPDSRTLGTAFVGLLRKAATRSPVVVAVDDPQWMDPSSARAVGFALRRVGDESVCLLATRRVGAASGGLEIPSEVRRVSIGPLAPVDLATLLRRRAGHRVGRPEAERIHVESGGNPYFALEIAMAAVGSAAALPGRAGPLPGSLRAVVGRRVAAQPTAVRQALLLAAAATRPTYSLLRAVLGPGSSSVIDLALDQGFLVSTGERLHFAHPLLANAAYWDATAGQRRHAHEQLSHVVAEPEEQARHAALATSGADTSVARRLDTAARSALARGAPEHAAELLEMALTLTPTGAALDEERRTLEAADARFHAGDGQGALELLQTVVTATAAADRRASALAAMARVRYRDESLSEAIEALEEALSQAEGHAELQVTIHRDLAWARVTSDVSAAEYHVREAVRLLTASADPGLAASIWTVSSVVHFLAGRGADIALLGRAEELQPHPAPLVPWEPLGCRAQLLKWSDRFDESRTCFRRLRRRLVRDGAEGSLPFVYFQHGELECWAGSWTEAAELARVGTELAELTQQDRLQALCLYVAGWVEAYRGRAQSARDILTDALAIGDAALSVRARASAVLGFLELSLGRLPSARDHLEAVSGIEASTGLRDPGVFRHVPDLVETLVLLGDLPAARPLAHALEERGRELDRPYALAAGARCHGLVAAAEGSMEEARAAFGRALVVHARLGQPFELARTRLVHGVVLRRAKQRAAARQSLEAALAGFDLLGARLWSERAASELGRVGAAVTAQGLTPTEARIAELVAAGRTNREVAAALCLSVKTVEVNLTRVYRKLGVRSRTELAHSRNESRT